MALAPSSPMLLSAPNGTMRSMTEAGITNADYTNADSRDLQDKDADHSEPR